MRRNRRIGWRYGCVYTGWEGQEKRWWGWKTIYWFDSEEEAKEWLNN